MHISHVHMFFIYHSVFAISNVYGLMYIICQQVSGYNFKAKLAKSSSSETHDCCVSTDLGERDSGSLHLTQGTCGVLYNCWQGNFTIQIFNTKIINSSFFFIFFISSIVFLKQMCDSPLLQMLFNICRVHFLCGWSIQKMDPKLGFSASSMAVPRFAIVLHDHF